ncbi:uncharacterized protein C8Q71DRAFT_762895 [Rhodofomes roseus]|uniref:Uncharacterized protein n=1 Tax=Rhodofomes roseus TaxID=34475 RepID=A0ABQ8KDB7_9APHY|nr:uncharacterized protein C8Q71DRAFT_762895 [Rhodofomes roseus]KAH9835639.1 hypothetical protein C8Q71DRAFT_762895 [Rhodofomes roseus]
MASPTADTPINDETLNTPASDAAVKDLAEGVAQVSVQDVVSDDTSTSKSERISRRPLRVYTRSQAMHLRESPLVKPPDGMPSLKDWFGDFNEQQANAKKDSETASTLTNGRERRFRREVEDSDSRPSFRSGLTQPSQMGNFRHQSLRTNDRDKDKDTERERERDLRDREGQERLRNLSDKYDRERLALSSSASGLRGKERDSAPHLATATSGRAGQAQASSLTARRAEGREPAKRKIGESSDDWRRGSDTQRSGRDDRSDASRRDRDRPRSKARDSSRSRREPSTRRDRDERDRDRPRDRRGDDRDDTRKDKDEYTRRERDDHRREWDDFYNRSDRDRDDHYPRGDRYRPRDSERETDDDPRRWRDDGRRDERVAARRERDRWDRHEERDRERPSEDARPRRGAARDRRVGAAEDGKDREDRREREKEAEPAWMETYVPTTPGGGILGGRGADGELDGIQAWKKGMKEKERQEKESEAAAKSSEDVKSATTSATPTQPEGQLDEIQMFKLMMKREADKKENEQHSKENAVPQTTSESMSSFAAASINAPSQSVVDETQAIINRAHADGLSFAKSTVAPDGSQSLLSVLIPSASGEVVSSSVSTKSPSLDLPPERSRVLASRATPTLPPPPGVAAPSSLSAASSVDASSSNLSTSSFNPPTGSRLLAFGSRAPPGFLPEPIPSKSLSGLESPAAQMPPPGIPGLPQKGSAVPLTSHPSMLPEAVPGFGAEHHHLHNGRHNHGDGGRLQRSFSPHSSLSQASGQFDELHEGPMLGQMADLRRGSAVDRAGLGLANDIGPSYGDLGPGGSLEANGIPGGPNYATGKGSRFAKFFETKPREAPPMPNRKMSGMAGFPSNAQILDPRQGGMGLNGGMNGNGDARTMEDIFAMLQNSAQNHRASPQIPSSGRIPSGGSSFGHNPTDLMQQQIHQQQHFAPNNHLDSLYDSRIDDRFVPDGMVPGLRPAPPRSRSREPSGVLFNEQLDDPLHFNARLQQQRSLDQMYSGSVPGMYSQQPGMMRNGGMPIQQQQFRGNPSPISNQNVLGGPGQRLPPGLANLGGRPPHDPSQFLGGPMGVMGGGLQGGMHGGSSLQQGGFNNLSGGIGAGGMGGYGGAPQPRGPVLQNPLGLNSMANMGLQNSLELRAANQAQLLGMGGGMSGNLGAGAGLRGHGPGFGPQHGPSGQLPSHMAMRQQQQQQQQPSHLPHMLPPHLSQQQGLPGGSAQGTQDLMALLMGGHRE